MLRTLKAWPGYFKNIFILFVRSATGDCRDIRAIFDQNESVNRNKVELRKDLIQFVLLFKKSTDASDKGII
jgi:hypothetical protein